MSLFNTYVKQKEVNGANIHLGEVITHIKSQNKYEIKELQAEGAIVYIISSPRVYITEATKLTRYYISFGEFHEYLFKNL